MRKKPRPLFHCSGRRGSEDSQCRRSEIRKAWRERVVVGATALGPRVRKTHSDLNPLHPSRSPQLTQHRPLSMENEFICLRNGNYLPRYICCGDGACSKARRSCRWIKVPVSATTWSGVVFTRCDCTKFELEKMMSVVAFFGVWGKWDFELFLISKGIMCSQSFWIRVSAAQHLQSVAHDFGPRSRLTPYLLRTI